MTTGGIGREQVRGLLAAGAQVVDVLSPAEYAEEHLPGATNIPLKELNAEPPGSSSATCRSSSTATTTSET